MSEDSGVSEQSASEPAAGAETEPTGAESVSPPKKGGKKKLWVVIIAIIVVAALIGTALYVLLGAKELTATIEQDPEGDIPAGAIVSLSVIAEWGDDDVTDDDDTDLEWSVSPSTLGAFDKTRAADVKFSAGNEGGSGTISCDVNYGDASYTATLEVTILPPTLDSVSIIPSEKSLDYDEEWDFTATALNSVGEPMTGATFAWSVSGIEVGDYTLSNTTGAVTTFSASVEGTAILTATATVGSESKSGNATVNVGVVVNRTVDYYWYDMFNHPIGDWYEQRALIGNEEFKLTDEYPYLYLWEGMPPGNVWVYTFMRMDMDAKNLTEVNMNEKPVFLPYFSDTVRGGNAYIDWYVNYITLEEALEKPLGPSAIGYFDGWYVALNGTVTLDEQAARGVLNLTSGDFDAFDSWWEFNGGKISNLWEEWMVHEAGPDRLDIFWMYEYPLQFVWFELDAEKSGDEIVLTFDTISWGAEALLTRWMKEAWMPTEWYFEDMTLQASIGPELAQIDMNTAVQYALYAYETTFEGEPCWSWEALMQDYVLSGEPPYDNKSLYDRYWNWSADPGEMYKYLNYAPGSEWYGMNMSYDYSPGAWNLSEGETLTLEWPAGDQMFLIHDPGATDSVIPDVSEVWGEMQVVYAEPMPSDDPDFITIDNDARQIIYTGPFDMWDWSRNQTAHQWLLDEWERIDVLPYGAPYIEFRPPSTAEPVLKIEDMPSEVEMGEVVTFNVTVENSLTAEPMTEYAGTVTFESDDLAALLPDDYTFVPATDQGTHEFTVVFNTVDAETHDATYTLTVYDVSDTSIIATVSDIHVVESPVIDHFGVVFSGAQVIADEPTDATVTAYNQWDDVFTGYAGTAEFDSDDVGADLPAPVDFTGLNGEYVATVTFSAGGEHYLNVSDSVATEATGSASVLVDPAAAADYFDLTGVNYPAEPDVPETMTVTVFDQYDREFVGYAGTVDFETNRTGDVTLPPSTPFTLGSSSIEVELTFTSSGMFTVWANDSVDGTPTGSIDVWVSDIALELDHFDVTGITDMWENNYSSVTVTAVSNVGTTYAQYDGWITFSSTPSVGVTLPDNYQFVPATDQGTHEFLDAVSFEEPGTYTVTVEAVADPTKTGSQTDIDIVELLPTTLVAESSVVSVMENDTFSMTVTVYHQYNEVFTEYDGVVAFSSSDDSGFAVLPSDYTFLPGDAGTHEFVDELSLSKLGLQTVTVTDAANSLSDSVDVEVNKYEISSLTYKIYDLFGEDWGPWWDTRVGSAWDTDRALTTGAGSMTYLYDAFEDKTVGIIYTPYRWNIQGSLLPNLDVHNPMFLPVEGTGPQMGAEATVHIYHQYLTPASYDADWIPVWEGTDFWHSDYYDVVDWNDDGWLSGAWINLTMNREAALEWLGMPTDADPATWWAANGAGYRASYSAWALYQGNTEYDIFNGYDYTYTDLFGLGPMMMLSGDADEVTLIMADVTWGYEALLTRWLAASELSIHQPYMEDFDMTLEYTDSTVNVSMDAVCQWSMKAVKQNATAVEWGAPCAYVWFPAHLDYIEGKGSHLESAYNDYASLTYQSWNCGDPKYENESLYEYTPVQFTLPSYGRLVVELPMGDVPGYYAEWVPSTAVSDAFKTMPSFAAYDALKYTGEMDLGYCDLSLAESSQWYSGNKTLIVQGPWEPVNPREGGLLYNGAPWIEFNVNPTTMAASSSVVPGFAAPLEEPAVTGMQPASTTSVTTEIVSLATVICAVTMLVAALVAGAGRRHEQ